MCGLVVEVGFADGDGLDSWVAIVAIAVCVCCCCWGGDGNIFHCAVTYLGLLGVTVSNCWSKAEEVAPIGT